MDSLLLHPKTKDQTVKFINNPSHALLVIGQDGSGKRTLVLELAANLIGIPAERLDSYPYLYIVSKSDQMSEISIDAIRAVINKLSLKPLGTVTKPAKKIIIVFDAQHLSIEAQNAMLKSIEEPPDNTFFLFCVTSATDVLPTISSRTASLAVLPVSLNQAIDFFSTTNRPAAIERAWRLSDGAVGLLRALLESDNQHPLKQAVDSAKHFIKLNQFDRLVFLEESISDKANLLMFLEGLNRVLGSLHHIAIEGRKYSQEGKILTTRKMVISSIAAINVNASPRLVALNLSLNLPL